jgi:hypothetical protein
MSMHTVVDLCWGLVATRPRLGSGQELLRRR